MQSYLKFKAQFITTVTGNSNRDELCFKSLVWPECMHENDNENISKHIWNFNFTMIIIYSEIPFSKISYHAETSQSICLQIKWLGTT